jgi:DNA polymerase-3 subunit alpha
MISRCLELIGGSITLDQLYQVPLDDPKTMDAFTRGDVMGIFQFEGRATRVIVNDVRPTTFMELADINALSRPGPLFSGATSDYIEVKRGNIKARHYHPLVDEITKWSNYQMIYQEQILQTCRRVGGFQWTEAAKIRKIISRKKGEAAFQEYRALFMDGASKIDGIDEKLAADIWGMLVTSGAYAFNVAHCISYSMLAFWCQWLKQNYPAEFYAASLSKQEKEDWPRLIRDGQEFGRDIKVLGPSLARLDATWTADAAKGEVYGGLVQIPGIADKSAPKILEEHAKQPFKEWAELQRIPGIGPKTIATIVASATSVDPYGVHRVEEQLTDLRRVLKREGKSWGWPVPSHTSNQMPADMDNTTVVWLGFVKDLNYQDYVEHERSKTGRQPEDIVKGMKRPDLMTSCVVRCYDDGEEDVYLRFNRFVYPKFKEALEGLKKNVDAVLVRGTKRKGFGITIIAKQLYVLSPDEDETTDAEGNEAEDM